MGNSKIKAVKRARFQLFIRGVYFLSFASAVTGFGAFVIYLVIRMGIQGEPLGNVALFGLIGIAIILFSIWVWKMMVNDFRTVRKLSQYLAEHEGDSDSSGRNVEGNRGQLLGRGLALLAGSILVIVWLIIAIDLGAPIWFPAMGMLFLVLLGSQAIFDLTDAVQLGWKEKMDSVEETAGTFSGKKCKLVILILSGVLAVYNVISFGMILLREMDTKAISLVLLANAALILSTLVEIKSEIKALYKRKLQKSDEPNENT